MNRVQLSIATTLAGLTALMMGAGVTMAAMNRRLQQRIGQRQQYAQ